MFPKNSFFPKIKKCRLLNNILLKVRKMLEQRSFEGYSNIVLLNLNMVFAHWDYIFLIKSSCHEILLFFFKTI